jgi:hypothetical protein
LPIQLEKAGRDVVVDWYMLDGFDTQGHFWVDANGLEMVPKTINFRRDYAFASNNTVPANFYPVTSALVIRDFNETHL